MKFNYKHINAKVTQHTPEAAGYDIYMTGPLQMGKGLSAKIPLGVSVDLDPGTYGQLVLRSSTYERFGLIQPSVGIIDSDYTGELHLQVISSSHGVVYIPQETALCQLIVSPKLEVTGVNKLTPLPRGDAGFGSSDRALHIARLARKWELTPAEERELSYVYYGLIAKESAARQGVSVATVSARRGSLIKKSGMFGTEELRNYLLGFLVEQDERNDK